MFSNKTTEEIQKIIALGYAKLAELAGEPLPLWNPHDGDINTCPDYGWILRYSSCTEMYSYQEWYATEDSARAALLLVAKRANRSVCDDGRYVDLTLQGCLDSYAKIYSV